MRLASFRVRGREGFGVVEDGQVRDLSGEIPTLREALATWGLPGLRARAGSGTPVPLADIAWRPPITDPDKILCVGLNYHAHASEASMAIPAYPSMFVRFPGAQVAHGVPVSGRAPRRSSTTRPSWRSSSAARGRHIAEADATTTSRVTPVSPRTRCATSRSTPRRPRRARTSRRAAPSARGS